MIGPRNLGESRELTSPASRGRLNEEESEVIDMDEWKPGAHVRIGELDMQVAFEIRCAAKGGRCKRVRGWALALPRGGEYVLLIVPVKAGFPHALVPETFEGACSVPGCPAPGHDRFYDKDVVYLAPQAGEHSSRLAERFEGGVTKTVNLCMDFQVLRPHFEEFRDKGKTSALVWAPGKDGTMLKPDWQRIGHSSQQNT